MFTLKTFDLMKFVALTLIIFTTCLYNLLNSPFFFGNNFCLIYRETVLQVFFYISCLPVEQLP